MSEVDSSEGTGFVLFYILKYTVVTIHVAGDFDYGRVLDGTGAEGASVLVHFHKRLIGVRGFGDVECLERGGEFGLWMDDLTGGFFEVFLVEVPGEDFVSDEYGEESRGFEEFHPGVVGCRILRIFDIVEGGIAEFVIQVVDFDFLEQEKPELHQHLRQVGQQVHVWEKLE